MEPQYIFLLGGADLEMLTIRVLLEKYSFRYYDKKLDWTNASLSQYAAELKRYAHDRKILVYGVELQERGVANIPAMQVLGAGWDEVQRIRLLDRRAQGVTEQDEQLAVQAIGNKIIQHGITVVKSGTNRFSSITDRLYPYEKLLICTDDELMYYGMGTSRIADLFRNQIKEGKMFYGGGLEGFIGTARGDYSKENLLNKKDIIIQLINK